LPVPAGHALDLAGKDDWHFGAEVSAVAASTLLRPLRAEEDLLQLLPRRSTEHAVAASRALVSVARSGWETSLFLRQLYTASARNEALEAVRAYTTREPLPDGRRLALDARIALVDLSGIGLARSWPLSVGSTSALLNVTLGAQLFALSRFAAFTSEGSILRNDSAYAFEGYGRFLDSRRSFEGYGQPGTRGEGVGIDLGLALQATERTAVLVSFANAFSKARIHGIASQEVRLQSDSRIVDSEGYLVSQPSVDGKYSAEALHLRLTPVTTVAAVHALPLGQNTAGQSSQAGRGIVFGVRVQRTGEIDLRSAWASTLVAPGCHAVAEYEFRFESKGLGLQCKWGQLMVRSDSSQLQSAKALGVILSLYHRLAF
jgi:hypothetical protein